MPFGYTASFSSLRHQFLFGKFVKYERIHQNISLNELAKIVGIDASYLSAIENGKKGPSKLIIEALCDAIDITFDFSEETERKGQELFASLYKALHYEKDKAHELFKALNCSKYSYSFAYPLVLQADVLYNVCLIDDHIDRQKIAILKDISKYEDNSFKIIVADYELMTFYDSYSSEEITNLYKETIQSINLNALGLLGTFPFAMFYLHAAEYFSDHNAIADSINATDKALGLFQDLVYVQGLLAAKGFKAKNYVLLKDYTSAIREYKELAKNPMISKDNLLISACYQNIGSLLFDSSQYERALNYFNKALVLDRDNKYSRIYIILIYYKQGDKRLNDALNEFKQFSDPLTGYVISLIETILKNDDRIILDIFDEIKAEKKSDLTEIIAKILFDHFYQRKMFKEASDYADFLLNNIWDKSYILC